MICCSFARVAFATFLPLSLFALDSARIDGIQWVHTDFAGAQKDAKSKNKRVFVYFWKDDCKDCVAFFGETLDKGDAVSKLESYICFSAKKELDAGKKLVEKFAIETFPSMLILNPDGTREAMLSGYRTNAAFLAEIDKITSGVGTVSYYRKRSKEKPGDLARKLEYADALAGVGEKQQHDKLVAEIRKADPKGKTLTGAWFLYRDVVAAVEADTDRDLKPMNSFLHRIKHKDIRFEGHCWIAELELGRDEREHALRAFKTAYSNCSKPKLLDFGDQLARVYWKVRKNLRTAEKKFVLKVARAQADLAESLAGGKTVGGARYEGHDYNAFLAGKLDTLSCCYYMAGRRKQAIEVCKRAMELAPKNADFKKRLEQIESGQ